MCISKIAADDDDDDNDDNNNKQQTRRGAVQTMCNALAPFSRATFLSLIVCLCHCRLLQEAQLSQRNRATLRVIEYFAKSLKVIRNNTAE